MLQASEAVVVSFGGTLHQIVNFDEEAGTITTNIWFGVLFFKSCFIINETTNIKVL